MTGTQLLICIALFCVVYVYSSDEITDLPGVNQKLPFKQYGGYLTVDKTAGRALYYWFAEAEEDPANAPLVLWQTGGPGCSSLLAMFMENGPLFPREDGTLELNPYSWNKKANMIWIESPAGVGFSYSNRTGDYVNVGDARTSQDLYNALTEFFDRYPQFQSNPFWITGESYGGHYVPNLAKTIVDENASGKRRINIKGFFVGNAWTYMPIDNLGAIDTWWQRAIVPESTVNDIKQYCNLSYYGPLKSTVDPAKCNTAVNLANKQMGDISIYDIYADVCVSPVTYHFVKTLAEAGSVIHQAIYNRAEEIKANKDPIPYNPCRANWLTTYLNRKDVQQAINVLNPLVHWSECSGKVRYDYNDVAASVIPVYQYLINKGGLRMMVYSGDVDAIVPYLGSRNWIDTLKLKIVESWRPWSDSRNQVGGYITVYEGLYFSTVRNAGHEVPSYQPDRAFILFNDFINGKLPK